ncbi:MAG: hypothetical protein AAGE52_22335 [Myxococcota bacterium]
MQSVLVELRAGEGGDDAKRLVEKQFSIYLKRIRVYRATQGGTGRL